MRKSLFNKSKLATAIALTCCTAVLSGCGDERTVGDTTVHGGDSVITEDAQRLDVSEIATPTATVVGIVQDTNGNPIGGASVSLAGQTVTADANGTYIFEDVAVTGFSEGGMHGSDLSVTIVPPTAEDGSIEYVSATVTVNPQAQVLVNVAGEIEDTSDPATTKNSLLSVIVADGLTISAGAAVLPMLEANIEGVLRDSATGLIIPNVTVALELVGAGSVGGGSAQEQTTNNDNVSYGVQSYKAVTDAEGKFSFSDVPSDSGYKLVVAGYGSIDSVENDGGAVAGEHVSTDNEVELLNLGDVLVDAIDIADNIAPMIKSISGSVSTGAVAKLKLGLDGSQGIVINFSEPMADTITDSSVFVVDTSADTLVGVASVALSTDGMALTVITASAIPAGHTFQIYLTKDDVSDSSENLLTNNTNVGWDDVSSMAGQLDAIKLELQTYSAPVTSSADIVITRIDEQGDAADADFAEMRAANMAFVDVEVNGANSIQQLNADVAGDRLESLNDTTFIDSGLGQNASVVETDVVRVSFNATDSSMYRMAMVDSSGNEKFVDYRGDISSNVNVANSGNDLILTLNNSFDGSEVELLLENVDVNDVITVTPYTDFGTALDAAAGSLLLTDNVAATTVLQHSYGEGDTTTGTADPIYGDGGELAGAGNVALGTPVLAITPWLLVPQASNEPVPLETSTLWDSLSAGNEVYANGDDKVNFSNIQNGYLGYDSTAVASYSPGSRIMGVAFSEPVTITAAPTYSGTAALSNFTAVDDVRVNDQAGSPDTTSADLVRFTVDNPLTLANDHGTAIDFTGLIQDGSGNVSTAEYNAKVIVEDKMPTLATSAVYNGNEIVITFADSVSVEENDTIMLDGLGTNLTITADEIDEEENQDVTTVTISLDSKTYNTDNSLTHNIATSINWAAVFDRGTFDSDADSSSEERHHSVLLYSNIEDVNGNSWSDYNGDFDLPAIAIRNDVDDFSIETTVSGYALDSDVITYTIESTHAIDVEATFDGITSSNIEAGAQSLTAEQVAEIWTVAGQTVDTSSTSATAATLSADGKILTVTIDLTADMIATDDLGFIAIPSITSFWDSSAAAIALPDDQDALATP